MGEGTKIDWCDATWNPLTGCYHGCKYCYARSIAKRFSGFKPDENPADWTIETRRRGGVVAELQGMQARRQKDGKIVPAPYPFGFVPTFHRYKLYEPKQWKRPRTVFTCSMSDMFGEWVPDEWIRDVFKACDEAPQHRYLFLTKNPGRYRELSSEGLLPRKHWYGYSATKQEDLWTFRHADDCPCENLFVSIEPIHGEMHPAFSTHTPADWVIIGAETGNRKDKVVPKKEWVEGIVEECRHAGIPVFMKESLRSLMGDEFRQELPWEATRF